MGRGVFLVNVDNPDLVEFSEEMIADLNDLIARAYGQSGAGEIANERSAKLASSTRFQVPSLVSVSQPALDFITPGFAVFYLNSTEILGPAAGTSVNPVILMCVNRRQASKKALSASLGERKFPCSVTLSTSPRRRKRTQPN